MNKTIDFHLWFETRMSLRGNMDKFSDPNYGQGIQDIDDEDETEMGGPLTPPTQLPKDKLAAKLPVNHGQEPWRRTPHNRSQEPWVDQMREKIINDLLVKARQGDVDAIAQLRKMGYDGTKTL